MAEQKAIRTIDNVTGNLHITNIRDIFTGEDVSYTETSTISSEDQCDGIILKYDTISGKYIKRDISTLTPFHFGVKRVAALSNSDVTALDDSTALQLFFDTLQKYPEYPVDFTARVPISKPVILKDWLNRITIGHLTIVKAYSPTAFFITGAALTIWNCGESIMGKFTVIMGGSNFGGTNGRGADFCISIINVRNTVFRRLFAIGAKHYGIYEPSADPNGAATNNNGRIIESAVANDCGIWNPVAVAFTEVGRNYAANSNNQFSTINADLSQTEVIFQPNVPLLLDNGDWHITISYDDVAKTANIFPCLRTAGYTGTYKLHNGGGYFNVGKDSGEIRMQQFLTTRVGKSFYTKSLYGGTINGPITQNCGIAIVVGAAINSAAVGGKFISPYFEANTLDVFVASNIGHLSIDDPIALNTGKVKQLKPIVTGGDPSPSGWDKIAFNGWIGDSASFNATTPAFPLTQITSGAAVTGVAAYDSVTRTRTLDLSSIGGTIAKDIRGEQGISVPILNCKIGDKINIIAPTGETVNGKAITLLQNLPPSFQLIIGRITATSWKVLIAPINNLGTESYDSVNTTVQGVSDLIKYVLKTGDSTILPGSLSQFFECNTTVALNQTLSADATTQAGTVLQFKNNGVNPLTITPGPGVSIDGATAAIVLNSKNDYLCLVSSVANTWRIVNLRRKSLAITSPAPTAVTQTSTAAGTTYTQADIQKMVVDITNLVTQLNATEARLADFISKEQSSGQLT